MAQGILVFIEQRKGHIRKASLEALSEAFRQAQSFNEPVVAILVGNNISSLTAEVSQFKPSKILLAQGDEWQDYSTEGYTAVLVEAIKKENPRYVFAAHTAMAKDLMPRAAARIDAPCVSDVMEFRTDSNNLKAVRPLYSGKAYGLFEFNSPTAFVTLRPNVFAAMEPDAKHEAPVEEMKVTPDKVRARVVESHAAQGQKIELSEATIIVSGGRLKVSGTLGHAAKPLRCAWCRSWSFTRSSRRWLDDHQHQVGQTGKTVSPQLYIACGISGAIQHLAGMSSSKVIVAINKDPDAPIFKHATYGLVGDVFEIVPRLTEQVRKLHENN